MGRPKKNGLDYFPLDVNIFRDIRVRRLKRKCGDNATLVYIALLTLIYNEGYYLTIDSDTAFALSEDVGYSEDDINAIIATCVRLGLFSEEMYTTHGILTSAAIQSRYVFIKDNDHSRITKYRLISEGSPTADDPQKSRVFRGKTPVSPPKTPVSDGKTPINPPKSAQSKVKESKEKKSKEKEKENTSSKSAAHAATDDGGDKASLTFSTASPLYPYTEEVDRVDLRSELAPYVSNYEEQSSEVQRLTQCGHPDNAVTGNLRLWREMQEQLARGVQPEFRVPSFDDLMRAWRAKANKGEVPGIISYQQWEALRWLGSNKYVTSRVNKRFVISRTAHSWDTLAEMTEKIHSEIADPKAKPFTIAGHIYAYARDHLKESN